MCRSGITACNVRQPEGAQLISVVSRLQLNVKPCPLVEKEIPDEISKRINNLNNDISKAVLKIITTNRYKLIKTVANH